MNTVRSKRHLTTRKTSFTELETDEHLLSFGNSIEDYAKYEPWRNEIKMKTLDYPPNLSFKNPHAIMHNIADARKSMLLNKTVSNSTLPIQDSAQSHPGSDHFSSPSLGIHPSFYHVGIP